MPQGSGQGHYRPNTGSNPYNTFHGPSPQQAFQHQTGNFQSQGFGGHPGFQTNHSNGNASLFPSALSNGNMSNNFATGNGGLGSMGGTGLASQEAQLRFAHGASLQQQQLQDGIGSSALAGKMRIRDVWSHNLASELATIRDLVDRYPYVSMDSEFPGVMARPIGDFSSKSVYHYNTLRVNVDLGKLVRLALTLFSPDGELVPPQPESQLRSSYANSLTPTPCTWVFNFKYVMGQEMIPENAVAMLKEKGVDFDKAAEMGIDHHEFGSVLQTSGLTTNEDVHWISFHSGYDFGFLLKCMTVKLLDIDQQTFLDNLKAQFPNVWDVKFLLKYAQSQAQSQARSNNPSSPGALSHMATNILNSISSNPKAGLQDLAEELGCQHDGRGHSVGADSMTTGLVLWQMRLKIFGGEIDPDLMGQIWGLTSVGSPASAETRAAVLNQPSATNGGFSGSKTEGGSSTPAHGNTSTPVQHGQGGYGNTMGNMGGGGAFGNFQYPR